MTGVESEDSEDRAFWLSVLIRLAGPVLSSLAQRHLREKMPVECFTGSADQRSNYSHLEAFGRLLAGISPWLELNLKPGEERDLKDKYADLAREALDSATDPQSPDFMNFTEGAQPLVDAAFLAHAIIRAPNQLWRNLDTKIQMNTIAALKSTRVIKPGFNNWLLFSAMIEAALCSVGERWDAMRIDYAVRQHEQWYKGDGIYGDGPPFHWDYYNSFVIQPMLIDVLRTLSKRSHGWDGYLRTVMSRARRHAEIQERMISPEGTFPPIGRSLAYRFGAFQLLGQMALMRQLPPRVSPAQVRGALTTVIRNMIEAPGTFDADGWLRIGFSGHQPRIGEPYISTGSLYLCSVGLLPLGLPPDDEFWTAAPEEWTSKKTWAGQNLDADIALDEGLVPIVMRGERSSALRAQEQLEKLREDLEAQQRLQQEHARQLRARDQRIQELMRKQRRLKQQQRRLRNRVTRPKRQRQRMQVFWARRLVEGPRRIKAKAIGVRKRYVFWRAMRRFSALPRDAVLPTTMLTDLIYGWDNPWSAKHEYIRACLEHARDATAPILECGSGLSTILLGLVAQSAGNKVWALEHDPYWAAKVRSTLKRYGIESVELCETDLRDYGPYLWYDPPKDRMPEGFSVVVCDGPPGNTRGGRYGMLPVMKAHLNPGCIVLLDDAVRKREKEIIARWAKELDTGYEILGSEKPFAVLTVPSTLD